MKNYIRKIPAVLFLLAVLLIISCKNPELEIFESNNMTIFNGCEIIDVAAGSGIFVAINGIRGNCRVAVSTDGID